MYVGWLCMKVVLLLCKTDYSSGRVQLLKSQRPMVWLRCASLEESELPRLPNSLSLKGMCCTGSITFSLRNSWYRNPVPVVDNEPQNWEHSASPCNDLAAALRGVCVIWLCAPGVAPRAVTCYTLLPLYNLCVGPLLCEMLNGSIPKVCVCLVMFK